MQDLIEECELEVLKKYHNGRRKSSLIAIPKQKRIRILMIHGHPKIQIASSANRVFKEIDISEAAGLFLCLEYPGKRSQFKLILKSKVLIFYESSKFHYDQFRTALKNLIEKFGRNQESADTCKTKNKIVIPDDKVNLEYVLEFNMEKEVMYCVDSPKDKLQNSIYRTFQDLVKERTNGGQINNQESADICKTKNKIVIPDDTVNLEYVLEFNMEKEVMYCVDSPKDKLQNSIYRTFQDLVKERTNGGQINVDLTDDRKNKYNIALFNGQLWVATVKYSENEKKKLHFGDMVVAVDGISVNDMFSFQEYVRNKTKFSIAVKRLPNAKVFLFNISMSNPPKISIENHNLTFIESKIKWIVTEVNEEFILDVLNTKHKDVIFSSSNKLNLVVAHKKEFVNNIQNPQHSCQI